MDKEIVFISNRNSTRRSILPDLESEAKKHNIRSENKFLIGGIYFSHADETIPDADLSDTQRPVARDLVIAMGIGFQTYAYEMEEHCVFYHESDRVLKFPTRLEHHFHQFDLPICGKCVSRRTGRAVEGCDQICQKRTEILEIIKNDYKKTGMEPSMPSLVKFAKMRPITYPIRLTMPLNEEYDFLGKIDRNTGELEKFHPITLTVNADPYENSTVRYIQNRVRHSLPVSEFVYYINCFHREDLQATITGFYTKFKLKGYNFEREPGDKKDVFTSYIVHARHATKFLTYLADENRTLFLLLADEFKHTKKVLNAPYCQACAFATTNKNLVYCEKCYGRDDVKNDNLRSSTNAIQTMRKLRMFKLFFFGTLHEGEDIMPIYCRFPEKLILTKQLQFLKASRHELHPYKMHINYHRDRFWENEPIILIRVDDIFRFMHWLYESSLLVDGTFYIMFDLITKYTSIDFHPENYVRTFVPIRFNDMNINEKRFPELWKELEVYKEWEAKDVNERKHKLEFDFTKMIQITWVTFQIVMLEQRIKEEPQTGKEILDFNLNDLFFYEA